MFVMTTWVVAFYIGILTWLGLAIFLFVKKKMTGKVFLFQVIIAIVGTIAAYFVYEYDIFGSGVKYID